MAEVKLPFEIKTPDDRTIYIELKKQSIKVTDLLALMRYMEIHKNFKKIVFQGPGGYLDIVKDY